MDLLSIALIRLNLTVLETSKGFEGKGSGNPLTELALFNKLQKASELIIKDSEEALSIVIDFAQVLEDKAYAGPAGLADKPLDLHLLNVGSIPTGPTHGKGRLQPHPGDVLKSTPTVWKSPRSGLNLEGRLSDPQVFLKKFNYSVILI